MKTLAFTFWQDGDAWLGHELLRPFIEVDPDPALQLDNHQTQAFEVFLAPSYSRAALIKGWLSAIDVSHGKESRVAA